MGRATSQPPPPGGPAAVPPVAGGGRKGCSGPAAGWGQDAGRGGCGAAQNRRYDIARVLRTVI